jgi:hypothetical protein
VVRRLLALTVLLAIAGCGADARYAAQPGPAATANVRLLDAPRSPGEVIVRGDASPASHGPYAFDGRYVVRFEQFAPEDPRLDFGAQTAFVVGLDRAAERPGPRSVRLFRAATRTQRTTMVLHGRFFVDVSFGDFPYVVRFTPQR